MDSLAGHRTSRSYGGQARGWPKPDVNSVLLILAFVAFFIGILIAGRELHQSYDVPFWVFTKK